jgi:hypothetical protein
MVRQATIDREPDRTVTFEPSTDADHPLPDGSIAEGDTIEVDYESPRSDTGRLTKTGTVDGVEHFDGHVDRVCLSYTDDHGYDARFDPSPHIRPTLRTAPPNATTLGDVVEVRIYHTARHATNTGRRLVTDGGRTPSSTRTCARCDSDAVPGSRFCDDHGRIATDGGYPDDYDPSWVDDRFARDTGPHADGGDVDRCELCRRYATSPHDHAPTCAAYEPVDAEPDADDTDLRHRDHDTLRARLDALEDAKAHAVDAGNTRQYRAIDERETAVRAELVRRAITRERAH